MGEFWRRNEGWGLKEKGYVTAVMRPWRAILELGRVCRQNFTWGSRKMGRSGGEFNGPPETNAFQNTVRNDKMRGI